MKNGQIVTKIVDNVEDEEKAEMAKKWYMISDQKYVELYGKEALAVIKSDDEEDNDGTVKRSLTKRLTKKCTKSKKRKKKIPVEDSYPVEEVEEIDKSLFTKLEKEKNARLNWRRLMTMIQLVKALSNREDKFKKESGILNDSDDEDEKVSCW